MLWVLKRTVWMRRFLSFEHPDQMFRLMDKKIIAISHKLFLLNWPYANLHESILKNEFSPLHWLENQLMYGILNSKGHQCVFYKSVSLLTLLSQLTKVHKPMYNQTL